LSAIFGVLHTDGRPADVAGLEAMNAALAAHGTEGCGTWIGRNVALGQRLMRFTPEDFFERQPLLSRSGLQVLVTDARLDNRPELAETLGIAKPELRQMPESEIILRAYEKWGTECPRYLIGAFAFALYDLRKEQLLLARSPFGERPLYYYEAPGSLAFSSAPKGLFALPWVPRGIDPQSLADYLIQVPLESGASFFSRVKRLRAGHILTARPRGISLHAYWRPDLRRETRFRRDSEYIEAFHALFERAVSDNLRSATPPGIMMSGGFDSTSVAAVAASQLGKEGKRLATFTEVPRPEFSGAVIKGRYADETPLVNAMATMYSNLDPKLIASNGGFYLDNIDGYFAATESPFPNASNRLWMEAILQASGLEGHRVLLTGVMGNNTISWSGSGLFTQLLRRREWNLIFRELRVVSRLKGASSALRTLAGSVSSLLPDSAWILMRMLRTRDRAPHRPWLRYSAGRPEFLRAQKVEERMRQRGRSLLPRAKPDTRASRYEKFLTADIRCDIERGYEALYQVQERDPTADFRLVEFCLSIPEEQYSRDGVSRRLVREAMRERLPHEVLSNPLRGLQAADWFERLTVARPRLEEELARFERSPTVRSVLDLERLRRLLNNMTSSGIDPDTLIRTYRGTFEYAVMTGRFLVWFESQ
jgi:asparagine synthase (glutamine-hydrolysing)